MIKRETNAQRIKRLNAVQEWPNFDYMKRERSPHMGRKLPKFATGEPAAIARAIRDKSGPHPFVNVDYAAIETRIMAQLCSTTLIVNHARVAAAPYGVWRTSPGVEALCLNVATSEGIVFG